MPEPLVQLRAVDKAYTLAHGRRNQVLAKVDLAIGQGEAVSLAGPSGAGKSTLVKIILGLERADAGRVLFHGQELAGLGRADRRLLRREVQVVWQDPFLFLNRHMTVRQLIEEPLIIHRLALPAQRSARARALLEGVGLDWSLAGRRPHQLSGGQCQRVALVRALASRPRLLICDESLTGLDTVNQARLVRLLLGLTQGGAMSLLFVSHDPKAAALLCQRLLFLQGGILTEQG